MKVKTSIELSETAMNLREQLAKELGISKQSVVEQALRLLAKQFNIQVTPEVNEQEKAA